MIPGPEPQKDSTTWPIVLEFAKWMEYKLAQNRHKGDAEGWRRMCYREVIARLDQESEELQEELMNDESATASLITWEAADVANFAMFAADIASL